MMRRDDATTSVRLRLGAALIALLAGIAAVVIVAELVRTTLG
jgi:hypothetical protein